MSFAELVGHAKQIAVLRSGLTSGRLHHAYLFVGPEGVGKRTAAIALAKAIHCEIRLNDACGACVNCMRISDANHPDVRMIRPLPDKKEISIQQIREVERELSYRSFTGRHKIAIIDPAILMNASAQNALLKTLEEPPKQSLIVLIAPNAGALLPTLRSRCVRLNFAPLPQREVAAYLCSHHVRTAEEAKLLAALSMGSIGLALRLTEDHLVEKRREWASALSSLQLSDYRSTLPVAEKLGENRDETLGFLKWAESWYRDLLIYHLTQKGDELVNLDMLEQIESQAALMSPDRLRAVIEKAVCAAGGVQRNLNRRMILEDFLFSAVGER